MITQTYTLNMIPGGAPVRVPVSQYDADSRGILFLLYGGVTPFPVPEGAVVTCDGTKSDKKGFSYPCDCQGNQVIVGITQQMTAAPGEAACQITVRRDGRVLGSANFVLAVEKAPLGDDTDLSESEISSLEIWKNQALAAAQDAEEHAADAGASAEAATQKAADAAASASAAASAKSDAVAAKTAAEQAESDADAAKSAAVSAQAAAESAKAAAETSASSAASSAGTATSKAGDAADSAASAESSKDSAALSASAAAQSAAQAEASASGKVSKTGDVMTGALVISRVNGAPALKVQNKDDANDYLLIYINANGVPLINSCVDGATTNTIALYDNMTWFKQPVSITSGGTGATTAAMALTNLGALPNGITLETYSVASDDAIITALDTVTAAMESDSYKVIVLNSTSTNTSLRGGRWLCHIFKSSDDYIFVSAVSYFGSGTKTISKYDGWDDWEWEVPALLPGNEYRTTERYNGKPVYTKLVDFGTLPSEGFKAVQHGTGVTAEKFISIEGIAYSATIGDSSPLPLGLSGSLGAYTYITGASVFVKVTTDASAYTAKFILKYYK